MSDQELNDIADQIISEYDKNHSGDLDKTEAKKFAIDFANALGKDPAPIESNFDEEFKKYDQNGNGVVCKDELKAFLMSFSESLR
mmetsp:Transcript_4256/g.4049  ORF Transcript_4256/g.4049 Transcript_4256/m.4049 type:complete len:85 (+) Transcript_4256:28-282(+)